MLSFLWFSCKIDRNVQSVLYPCFRYLIPVLLRQLSQQCINDITTLSKFWLFPEKAKQCLCEILVHFELRGRISTACSRVRRSPSQSCTSLFATQLGSCLPLALFLLCPAGMRLEGCFAQTESAFCWFPCATSMCPKRQLGVLFLLTRYKQSMFWVCFYPKPRMQKSGWKLANHFTFGSYIAQYS